MEVLVVGGRAFLGRSIVEYLRVRKHHVTLFNRGKTNPELFSDLEIIRGDRNQDFDLFRERRWDAVIDTCGHFPDGVAEFAKALATRADHYVFVSTCSVYDFHSKLKVIDEFDESAPLVDLNVDPKDSSWNTYGARKFLCERAVERSFRDRATYVRPGLIVGPHDSTYRFPYWADRISEGRLVLAPGRYDAPCQFIDARDLAKWIVDVCEKQVTGTFNACGPAEPLCLGAFLEAVVRTINPAAKLEWVPEKFLRLHNIACWSQLPLWVYEEIEVFLQKEAKKAIQHGLEFRPMTSTILDTYAWSRTLSSLEFKNSALPRDREASILQSWASAR